MKKKEQLNINKKKQMPFILRLIICIIISFIFTKATYFKLNILNEEIENNYDYSTIKEIEGTIVRISYDYDDDSYTLIIEIPNKKISIGIGDSISGYYEGQQIIIYTDTNEKTYSLSQRGIAFYNSNAIFFYFFLSIVIVVIVIVLQ
jgi:hypothetical protein